MKPSKVVDIVRAIPAREVKSTVINWPRMIETEIDGYLSHRGLVILLGVAGSRNSLATVASLIESRTPRNRTLRLYAPQLHSDGSSHNNLCKQISIHNAAGASVGRNNHRKGWIFFALGS